MSIRKVVGGLVAGIAGRVVEAPVRDIVDEVLNQQELPPPEEVGALRSEVKRLATELASMQGKLGELVTALEGLQTKTESPQGRLDTPKTASSAPAAPAEEAAPPAPPAKSPPKAKAAPKKAAPKKAAPKKAAPKKAASKKRGRKSLAHLGCGVSGCTTPHRSKGFCANHYQAWRRGNLDGFVGPEGLVGDNGGTWQVDKSHAGIIVTIDHQGKRAKVLVNGKSVRSRKIA